MSADLCTRYMGLDLSSPLVASASPMTGDLEMLRRLEEAGAAAVVLPSLFEEQIDHQEMAIHHLHEAVSEAHGEALSYFPDMEGYNAGPEGYLSLVRDARKALRIPVIASLNGTSNAGWTRYARMMEEAGASAIELNIYFVAGDPEATGAQVEERYLDLVRAVRQTVKVPLAVKIGPYFSSLAHMARRLVEAGANGLVLFNRFLGPDIDPETLEVRAELELSTRSEIRLPLRWMAILRGRVQASLAATSGAHDAIDVVKLLLAGADVVMMASTLLRNGPQAIGTIRNELRSWLDERDYVSVEQMKGSLSQQHSPDPGAFERANYMKALQSYASRWQ